MNFKKIHKTISLVVSILALSLFGGCGTDEKNGKGEPLEIPELIYFEHPMLPKSPPPQEFPELEPLKAEIEEQIIADYRIYLNHISRPYEGAVWIDTYCGTYNDGIAVLMDGDFAEEALDIEYRLGNMNVGIFWIYSRSSRIHLWKNNTFYPLYLAFDNSFLTRDDLEKIAYYNNSKLIPYEYHPALQFLNPLLEREILLNYWASYFRSYNNPPPKYKIRMVNYYGIYNGCVVVDVYPGVHYTPSDTPRPLLRIIGDTVFRGDIYPSVWNTGQFYRLEEAYEKGLLTPNDIRSIAYYDWHDQYIHYTAESVPKLPPP